MSGEVLIGEVRKVVVFSLKNEEERELFELAKRIPIFSKWVKDGLRSVKRSREQQVSNTVQVQTGPPLVGECDSATQSLTFLRSEAVWSVLERR